MFIVVAASQSLKEDLNFLKFLKERKNLVASRISEIVGSDEYSQGRQSESVDNLSRLENPVSFDLPIDQIDKSSNLNQPLEAIDIRKPCRKNEQNNKLDGQWIFIPGLRKDSIKVPKIPEKSSISNQKINENNKNVKNKKGIWVFYPSKEETILDSSEEEGAILSGYWVFYPAKSSNVKNQKDEQITLKSESPVPVGSWYNPIYQPVRKETTQILNQQLISIQNQIQNIESNLSNENEFYLLRELKYQQQNLIDRLDRLERVLENDIRD